MPHVLTRVHTAHLRAHGEANGGPGRILLRNSGMKEAVAKGIIRGRSYGGVAFLWHSSLNKYIQVLPGDDSGRCLAIKVQSDTKSIVVFSIYFPCSESSSEYRAELVFILDLWRIF